MTEDEAIKEMTYLCGKYFSYPADECATLVTEGLKGLAEAENGMLAAESLKVTKRLAQRQETLKYGNSLCFTYAKPNELAAWITGVIALPISVGLSLSPIDATIYECRNTPNMPPDDYLRYVGLNTFWSDKGALHAFLTSENGESYCVVSCYETIPVSESIYRQTVERKFIWPQLGDEVREKVRGIITGEYNPTDVIEIEELHFIANVFKELTRSTDNDHSDS